MKKKRIAVLVEEQYQELEVWVPYYRLKETGAEVLLIGQEKGKVYKGKFGYPAQAEADYSQAKAGSFDAVIVPHLASATQETRVRMGLMAADGLLDVLIRRRKPLHGVNAEVCERLGP